MRRSASKSKNKKTNLINKHKTQTNTLAFKTYYLVPHAARKRTNPEYVNIETAHPADRRCAVSIFSKQNSRKTISTITRWMRGNVKKNCVNFLQRKSVPDAG